MACFSPHCFHVPYIIKIIHLSVHKHRYTVTPRLSITKTEKRKKDVQNILPGPPTTRIWHCFFQCNYSHFISECVGVHMLYSCSSACFVDFHLIIMQSLPLHGWQIQISTSLCSQLQRWIYSFSNSCNCLHIPTQLFLIHCLAVFAVNFVILNQQWPLKVR